MTIVIKPAACLMLADGSGCTLVMTSDQKSHLIEVLTSRVKHSSCYADQDEIKACIVLAGALLSPQ